MPDKLTKKNTAVPVLSLDSRMAHLEGSVTEKLDMMEVRYGDISDSVQRTAEGLASVKESQSVILIELKHIRVASEEAAEHTAKINKVLFEGNGKASIVTRLTVLEDKNQSYREDRGRLLKFRNSALIVLISIAASGLVSAAVALWK